MNSTLDLNTLSRFREMANEYCRQGSDYVFIRLTDSPKLSEAPRLPEGPMRVEGMLWVICLSGSLLMEVNLEERRISKGGLMVFLPGYIVEIKDIDWANLDCYILFLSPDFIKNINVDLNVVSQMPRARLNYDVNAGFEMKEGEMKILRGLCELLRSNTETNGQTVYSQSISRSLIAAMIYQGLQTASERYAQAAEPDEEPGRSRRSNYVSEFMKLVRNSFSQERSVGYYASRLCITPKYLSLIIKEQTGRTAGEVIDSFVILEAKNLLRFSGMNIQQVANTLNFPSQSAFGKYFKHLTGQSPSEYQHS